RDDVGLDGFFAARLKNRSDQCEQFDQSEGLPGG
ncbi:MAG: hypothetical protein QG577_1706, partial [Thermodesulfobacteriota bacterium]|nr:hypothetical protein [Thermodesulfobacteriota bacterium]